MKLKNILLTVLAAGALTSCNDYLEVDAPSAYNEEVVFGSKQEMERAVNGVYAKLLVNDLYGNNYQYTFQYNTDVEFTTSTNSAATHNSYRRYDCDSQGGDINKFWAAAYAAIEAANKVIYGIQNSPIYDENDGRLMQMLGEVICMRAMVYHDLVVMFGDVPYTTTPTVYKDSYVVPIMDREQIQDSIISQLQTIAPKMKFASESGVTVERCSKEFAWGMIARVALTAGGYSLRPDKQNADSYGTMLRPEQDFTWTDSKGDSKTAPKYKYYYELSNQYADSVINHSGHELTANFQEVFINECNYIVDNTGDPIFEIPFAINNTGNTGYIHGPKISGFNDETVGNIACGPSSGSATLNAFYRYTFREGDARREFTNGLWQYGLNSESSADSATVNISYTAFNNKWSKLWSDKTPLTTKTKGGTGINFPYMRLADVMLMFAETENELNDGPTSGALACLQKVHNRAFVGADSETLNNENKYIRTTIKNKETFHKAILNERKWELAGENSRWRDLVRNNLLAQEVTYSFARYYSIAASDLGMTGYDDEIVAHDAFADKSDNANDYFSKFPDKIYYCYMTQKQYNDSIINHPELMSKYGMPYPNKNVGILNIFNPYRAGTDPGKINALTPHVLKNGWSSVGCHDWTNDDNTFKDQINNSFFGYIRVDMTTNTPYYVNNGQLVPLGLSIEAVKDELPPVRYILPIPNDAIQRSGGVYKNYYGYKI